MILVVFVIKSSGIFFCGIMVVGLFLLIVILLVGCYIFLCYFYGIIGGNLFSIVLLCDGDCWMFEEKFLVVMVVDEVFDLESYDFIMYD